MNDNMVSKKAVSPVIASVSLVLLTIGALAVLASFVVPWVQEQLEDSVKCIDYQDYFQFEDEFGLNCFNGSAYGVSIRAGNLQEEKESKVEGFFIKFIGNSNEYFEVVEGGQKKDNFRMINISATNYLIPKARGAESYVYETETIFESIEVYPILKGGEICSGQTNDVVFNIRNCPTAVQTLKA